MKKMVFALSAFMLLAAGAATAGTNLLWTDCAGGGGVSNLTFACTNSGTAGTAFLSFNPTASHPMMTASDFFIDVQAAAATDNTWWFPATLGTRWGTGSTDPPSGVCTAWWAAAPSGPIVFAPTAVQNPSIVNRFRLRVSAVVAAGEEQPVAPGTEYGSGSLVLKKSVGTAGNVECTSGGAIGIVHFELSEPGLSPFVDESPDVVNCATFQGGGGKVCPGATPTKKATWGSIKALYR